MPTLRSSLSSEPTFLGFFVGGGAAFFLTGVFAVACLRVVDLLLADALAVVLPAERRRGVALAAAERLKAGVEGIVAVILAVGAIEGGEDGLEAVVVLLRNGIEFVIMTVGAAHTQAEE